MKKLILRICYLLLGVDASQNETILEIIEKIEKGERVNIDIFPFGKDVKININDI